MAVFPDVALLVGTIAIFEKKQPAVVLETPLHHCHCFPSVATLSSLHFWVAQGGHFPNQLMTTQSSEWLLYPPSMPAIHSNPWRWNVKDWLGVSFAPGVVGTCRNWRNMGLDFATLNRVVEYLHRLAANLQETAQRIVWTSSLLWWNFTYESYDYDRLMPYDPISGPMSANRKPNHHSKMEICEKVAIWVPLGPSSLQAPFDEHRVQEATDRQCPSSSATSRHLQAKGSELVSSVSLQFNLQYLEVEERVNFHKSPGLKLISLKYNILPNPHAHTFKKNETA